MLQRRGGFGIISDKIRVFRRAAVLRDGMLLFFAFVDQWIALGLFGRERRETVGYVWFNSARILSQIETNESL
jgi:hypothetical protein